MELFGNLVEGESNEEYKSTIEEIKKTIEELKEIIDRMSDYEGSSGL